MHTPVNESHNRTVSSLLAEAIRLPQDEYANERISSVCPTMVNNSSPLVQSHN
jgi:hypothetical protein